LLAPEFGNVAWKKVMRGECDILHASKQLRLFLITDIRYHDCRRLVSSALTASYKCKITVYDSFYLVLAKTINAQLATLDEQLQKAADILGIESYK
jgi:predicted nucleic acid-binding protein